MTSPEAVTLKECPFCGEDASYFEDDNLHPERTLYMVACDNKKDCFGHFGHYLDFITREDAATAWNTRAAPRPTDAEEGLPTFKDIYGMAPNATGGLPAEDFIAKISTPTAPTDAETEALAKEIAEDCMQAVRYLLKHQNYLTVDMSEYQLGFKIACELTEQAIKEHMERKGHIRSALTRPPAVSDDARKAALDWCDKIEQLAKNISADASFTAPLKTIRALLQEGK
jgi:hypothetical protein